MKKIIDEVIDILKDSNYTLCSCESLTGGLFSSTVTSYSGVSKFFKGCICSYSTLVKEDLLGIDKSLVDKVGVVSSEVAKEMALSSSKLLKSDIAISFTGNAGPSAMEGKEVGLVFIGIKFLDEIETYKLLLKGSRNEIRENAVLEGFNILKDKLGKRGKSL